MNPFNLEKAKKGVPMITRSGKSAKFITHLQGWQPAPLVIDVDDVMENYYLTGRFEEVHDNNMDLFMDEM